MVEDAGGQIRGSYANIETFEATRRDATAHLDPRWEWIDVSTLEEGRGTSFVRAYCNHLEIEPIRDVSGELVARWCRTCDKQWTIPIEIR